MCTVTSPYKESKTFTGYKCVIKRNEKIYSPVTGLEYKVGPVPKIKKKGRYANRCYGHVMNPSSPAYDPNMVGKTGLFDSANIAILRYGLTSTAVVKMTISGDLHNGVLNGTPGCPPEEHVIVGNHIDKIKIPKELYIITKKEL